MTRPVVLIILDGWGLAPPGPGNAVELAATPVFDALVALYPTTRLNASGRAVGLPEGQMGNSEVGHLTIGAGRVVRQDLVRLAAAIADGSFLTNAALLAAVDRAASRGRPLHVSGLVSDGGVHSHVDHLRAIVAIARSRSVPVVVHAITDGRDVAPHQAGKLLATLEAEWSDGRARIATVCGRLWAMDRDQRLERTQRFVDAVTDGTGHPALSAGAAVQAAYDAGVTDEFIEPTIVGDPAADRLTAADELVFTNFRPDRARQVCRALCGDGSGGAPFLTAMTAYWDGQPGAIAFGADWPESVLADELERAGLAQVHAAETEKYPHVTYFLNGGREAPHEAESRILVPSPRDVRTYDERPAMSAPELCARVCTAIERERPDFVVVNFANPDMVGHTGVIPAVIEAVETADRCLGEVLASVRRVGGVALVTADHGNAEKMLAPDGSPFTAHTTNPVPFILTDTSATLRPGGSLVDVAPTVLDLLELKNGEKMTGLSLRLLQISS